MQNQHADSAIWADRGSERDITTLVLEKTTTHGIKVEPWKGVIVVAWGSICMCFRPGLGWWAGMAAGCLRSGWDHFNVVAAKWGEGGKDGSDVGEVMMAINVKQGR